MIQAIPDEELIRQTTRQVLDRPEFASSELTAEWWKQFIEWFIAWSRKFGPWAAEHPVLGALVMVVLILVLLALIAHMAYVAFGNILPFGGKPQRSRSREATSTILEGVADTWRGALLKARAALEDGNPRLAVWISHRVLLGLLDESGAIHFAAGKTNTDYLHECEGSHPWRQTLGALTALYDRVVYAHRAVDSGTVHDAVGQVEKCHRGGALE